MSISNQRNSLKRSSISINIIQKSVSGLSNGIRNLRKNANKILSVTQNNNNFKRTLIRKDNDFFNKRRENVLRKQREDELESTSVTGVAKKQGNLFQQSTRGFFGRILDFLGVLLLGWALTNLPKFIAQFQKLFKLITKVVEIMGGFIKTITGFLTGIATGVGNLFGILNRFDLEDLGNDIRELFEKGLSGFARLNEDLVLGLQALTLDKDVMGAVGQGFAGESTVSDEPVPVKAVPATEQDDQIGEDDESNQQIERRNLGGPVEAGQPVIVGDAAGTDSRSAEVLVSNVDGRVISNNELEDIIASVNSLPSDEEVSPESPSSLSEEDEEAEEDLDNLLGSGNVSIGKKGGDFIPSGGADGIEGISATELEKNISNAEIEDIKGETDKALEKNDEKVTPKKRKVPVLKEIKNKKRSKVLIVPQSMQSVASSPLKMKTIPVSGGSGDSSVSTLLDFQSVSSLKYT